MSEPIKKNELNYDLFMGRMTPIVESPTAPSPKPICPPPACDPRVAAALLVGWWAGEKIDQSIKKYSGSYISDHIYEVINPKKNNNFGWPDDKSIRKMFENDDVKTAFSTDNIVHVLDNYPCKAAEKFNRVFKNYLSPLLANLRTLSEITNIPKEELFAKIYKDKNIGASYGELADECVGDIIVAINNLDWFLERINKEENDYDSKFRGCLLKEPRFIDTYDLLLRLLFKLPSDLQDKILGDDPLKEKEVIEARHELYQSLGNQ